ncbi:MAG: OstA family protein [Ferruginibacter sp.]|nr:OstA family protein [Ferruginibacter sp.]
MKSAFTFQISLFLVISILFRLNVSAQNPPPTPASNGDTLRVIQIIQGKSLREKRIDSVTSLQTIAGNVVLKEGTTIFSCDSAVINKHTNVLEAFGNIHINQDDSIHTYSQYLKYIGKDRMAYLKKEVRLTDNKGTLYTQELEYDLKASIGKYFNGGRVVNGKTTLTSTEGVYYADTKDVFFKKKVHLVDPKYDVRNDTLLYNTQTQITSWNTPSIIKSKNGGDIYSSNGTYDLKNGKAFFGNRTVIKDSTRTYTADNSAYDELTGIAQLEGNAIIKDSVNGYTILGNTIYLDKNNNSFLATRKPVLIFKGDGNDSTFIAADTLFSGVERRDSMGRKISASKDTLKKDKVVNLQDSGLVKRSSMDSVGNQPTVKNQQFKDTLLNRNDHFLATRDSIIKKDSIVNAPLAQTKSAGDSLTNHQPDSLLVKQVKQGKPDSLRERIVAKKISPSEDTLAKTNIRRNAKDTAIRYFIAFHKVRIFNDSLQSVCDSLYYSSEDSIFRLFQNPLVFSNNSQIAGDTIYMYTKNKKADRLYVFENGIIINKANDKMYNQVAGRTLNGYFKDGEMDYMRAKGSPAESVYYPLDDDSAYIGMNRSKGDVIDVYFLNKAVNKVKFINAVDGTLYPIRQIPEDQKFLKNYKWQDERRPKNKLELFE